MGEKEEEVRWNRGRRRRRNWEGGMKEEEKKELGRWNGREGGRGMVKWRRRKGGLRWRVRKDVILNKLMVIPLLLSGKKQT